MDSIERTVSILQHHEKVDINIDPTYIKDDEMLSKGLEAIIAEWKDEEKKRTDNRDNIDKKIETLAHQYRYTEFSIIDLTAQIEGFKARIYMLDRDISKLNSLPQILPILR